MDTPTSKERLSSMGELSGFTSTRFNKLCCGNCGKKDPLSNIIEFRKDDFHDASFDNDTFDLVFFSNCFAYVTDYFKIIEEMKRVTKNGGRIAC